MQRFLLIVAALVALCPHHACSSRLLAQQRAVTPPAGVTPLLKDVLKFWLAYGPDKTYGRQQPLPAASVASQTLSSPSPGGCCCCRTG